MENAADKAEQRFKAAVFADEAAHGRDKDRDHDRLKHPGRAGAHVPQQLGRVHRTGGEHDDGAGENAGQQHEEHVNARHAANEHQQIRDGLCLAQAGCSRRIEKRRSWEEYLLFQIKLDSVQYERLFRGPHLLMRTDAVLLIALRKLAYSSKVEPL